MNGETCKSPVWDILELLGQDELSVDDWKKVYGVYNELQLDLALRRKWARQAEHNARVYELQQMERYQADGLKVTDARNRAKLDNREQVAKVFEAQCDVDILTADVTTLQHIITHLEQKE